MDFPTNHSGNASTTFRSEDIRDAETNAKRALRTIQTLYDEIMGPKIHSDFDFNPSEDYCSSESSTSSVCQNENRLCITQPKLPRDVCRKSTRSASCFASTHNRCVKERFSQNYSYRNSVDGRLEMQLNNFCKNDTVHIGPKDINNPYSVTIPRPFSLTVENVKRQEAKALKIAKMKEEINSQIDKELNVKICSKPVPKHVHMPLYTEMMKRDEKRKMERKEKCHEIVSQVTKPFNLSYSAACGLKKAKSITDMRHATSKNNFKAKPLPVNILSENISKKLRDKEEIRRILIAQRAEVMLKESSLPFSPKHIPRSQSMNNLNKIPKHTKIDKPNIEAITKRLYTLKCRDTIENWNNQVLQTNPLDYRTVAPKRNTDKNANGELSGAKVPNYDFPFYNFPVRMSTASLLREKKIREEITMRRKRVETGEQMREEMARKEKEIIKNIWPRLKSIDPTIDSEREIEEKVRSLRASQKNREEEYERELDEMMDRVSNQLLLMERQSKERKDNSPKERTKVQDQSSDEGESTESEPEKSLESQSSARSSTSEH